MKTQYILSGLIAVSIAVCACNETPYYDSSMEANQLQLTAGQNANAPNDLAVNDQNSNAGQSSSDSSGNAGVSGDTSENENNTSGNDNTDNTGNDNHSDDINSDENNISGHNQNDETNINKTEKSDVYIWGYTEQFMNEGDIDSPDSKGYDKWVKYIHSADEVEAFVDDNILAESDYGKARKEIVKNKLMEIDYQDHQVAVAYFGLQPFCPFVYNLEVISDTSVELQLISGETMSDAESAPAVIVLMPSDKTYDITLTEKMISTQEHLERLQKQDYIKF